MSSLPIKNILAPLLSLAFLVLGMGFFSTFVSMRLNTGGFSDLAIGTVQGCYYIGMFLGAARVERLIRRIGHIRSYAAFSSTLVAAILLLSVLLNAPAWALLRLIMGICVSALYVVVESWILAKSLVATRGICLAIYMTTLYAAQSCSQFILDFFDPLSALPFTISAILCVLSTLPVATTWARTPALHVPKISDLRQLFLASPFGFIGCLVGGILLSSIYTFLPVFAQDSGASPQNMVAITIAGGLFLQWPIGHISDIWDRRKTMICIAFVTLIPCLLLFSFAPTGFGVWTALFFLGGLTFTVYPLGISQVCDRLADEDVTAATGVLALAYSGGCILGPFTAPLLTTTLGSSALFLYLALFAALLGCTGCITYLTRPPVPAEDQSNFIAVPGTSPVAFELGAEERKESTAE